MKDYYASLELNFGASQSEIKASYRRLAKVYHPDLHFGNRVYEEKFKEINEKHKKANIRSIWYYSVFFPVVEILSAISIAMFIWFAGVNANTYNIKLGDITFFIMMINMVFRPIRMLADRLNTLQMGVVAAERVFKVIDTTDVIIDNGTELTSHIKTFYPFWS